MKCSIILHFIWVFTVCQSTCFGAPSIQRINQNMLLVLKRIISLRQFFRTPKPKSLHFKLKKRLCLYTGGKQWNEIQKEVSYFAPTVHPGTFEITPKGQKCINKSGVSNFYEKSIKQHMVNYRDAFPCRNTFCVCVAQKLVEIDIVLHESHNQK